MSDDYCKSKGLDYGCNTPAPQFSGNKSVPFCKGVGSSFYDPANCDPGYWCGCNVLDKAKCIPQNNSEHWSGHFTTTDSTIVFSFGGSENATKCANGMYCAGKDNPKVCPDNCPPGKICKTPATREDCPSGGYCPVSSIVKIKCKGLQSCNDSGQRRFKPTGTVVIFVLSLVLCVAGLFIFRKKITTSARVSKAKKMEKTKERKENVVEVEHNVRKSILPVISDPIDIEFDRIRLTLPNIGTIMQGASGSLKHGTITAIMGPSGAGKTTMLNLLSGKVDRTSGIIKINGEEKEMCEFKDVIGFAPQVDTMHRELTVEEIVVHNALMRLPVNMSKEDKLQRVDDVLEVLEIDHVRDTVIGDARVRGLSGGQLKRTNIAMEMVSNPKLLCLDEPTSGLDSVTSFVVIKALKEMAQTGVNVVLVLHQPKKEIFVLFNQVLLLARGGLTAFIGSPIEMISYFETLGFPFPPEANPADFAMDVLGGVVPHATNPHFKTEDFVLAWMTADENPNSISLEDAKSLLAEAASDTVDKVTISSRLKKVSQYCSDICVHFASGFKKNSSTSDLAFPGMFQQSLLLTYRAFLQRIRTPMMTVGTLIAYMILGLILPSMIGTGDTDNFVIYKGILEGLQSERNDGVIAFLRQNVAPIDGTSAIMSIMNTFAAIACCVSVYVLGGNERLVFFRETSTGQSVVAYFFSKVIETFAFMPFYAMAFMLFAMVKDFWFIQTIGTYYIFTILLFLSMFSIGMICSLFFGRHAGLFSLVANLIIMNFSSGLTSAIGDASSSMAGLMKLFPIFWTTQGIITEEINQYDYSFDVAKLNAATPNSINTALGAGSQIPGSGMGKGWDLDTGVGGNIGYCLLALFGWYFLVLLAMKLSSFKKHR